MPVVVRFPDAGQVDVFGYQREMLPPEKVRVRTLYSGISAGTELTAYRGSNPYLTKLWQEDRRIFVPGQNTVEYPVEGWGYEEVGEVVEVAEGVSAPGVGDLVYGTWGHRSEAVLSASYAAGRVLPDGLDPRVGIFAHIGAIAMNAILDADIHVGETVAVFGQGTPGQIVSQLARLNGGTVAAVDAVQARLDLATRLGADVALDALASPSPAERLKADTGGRGADVCIEISGSYAALQEAVRAVAYNSRVVACGFYQGVGTPLAFGEEFHHNRAQLICSQISGVARSVAGRWDIDRLQRTVMGLAAAKRLDLDTLISHVYPPDRAAEAFALLDHSPEQAMQVVLDFREVDA